MNHSPRRHGGYHPPPPPPPDAQPPPIKQRKILHALDQEPVPHDPMHLRLDADVRREALGYLGPQVLRLLLSTGYGQPVPEGATKPEIIDALIVVEYEEVPRWGEQQTRERHRTLGAMAVAAITEGVLAAAGPS